MKGVTITDADYVTATLVVEREPGVWTVPSVSEALPDGSEAVLRVVRATGNRRGEMSFECDCPAGYCSARRVVCRHVRAVVAWLRLRAKENA